MRCSIEARSPIRTTLDEIEAMPLQQLETHWQDTFGCPRPKGVKRRFLQRALAYRVQAKNARGLSRRTKKALEASLVDGGDSPAYRDQLKPGTRLVREWNGVSHVVYVLEKGVAYNGKVFASLSAVAREITGTGWSGPRFFGV